MNMFKPNTDKTPEEYIAKLDEPRKSQIQQIHDFIKKIVPHLEPYMQSGMIGYGKEHYKTKSGREGDWYIIGLASNKNYISVYCCAAYDGKYVAEHNKDKLAKASIGRSCIRYKKFEDIDFDALGDVLKQGAKAAKESGMFAM